MTTTRHTRAPHTRCAHPDCPFLTRAEFCPLHRHADPSAPQTTRTDAGSTTHQYTKEHKMLSSTEIVKAVTSTQSGGSAGSLAFLARREKGKATVKGTAFLTDAQRQRPIGSAPTGESYAHPGHTRKDQRRGGGPLSAVEMQWLQRLPDDASKTSFDDASAVAALAADISKMQHPADARLVASHWLPIRDYHDGNEANVTLANARSTPVPPVPSSTLPALVEAVTAEHPELTPGEATGRAKAMLDQAVTKRGDARAQSIADARDKLSALDDATRTRSAVTR